MSTRRKAYIVGGGIGSLAAAAFMIRDGGMHGEDVSILEATPPMGGSLDTATMTAAPTASAGSPAAASAPSA